MFLYLCVIYGYFQTTGSWAAKIGKVQIQLKKIVFDMFYWIRYRYHGNIAGSKPALNNGFDLFSEKYWPIDTSLVKFDREIFCYFVFCILTSSEHALCQISIFV